MAINNHSPRVFPLLAAALFMFAGGITEPVAVADLITEFHFAHQVMANTQDQGSTIGCSGATGNVLPFQTSVLVASLDSPPSVNGTANYVFTDDGSAVVLNILTSYALGRPYRAFCEGQITNGSVCSIGYAPISFVTAGPIELTVSMSNTLTSFNPSQTSQTYVQANFRLTKNIPPGSPSTVLYWYQPALNGHSTITENGTAFLEANTPYSIYEYTCAVSPGSIGAVYDGGLGTSSFSVLMTPCIPNGDINLDGMTNGNDIQAFIAAALAGSTMAAEVCRADFNGNQVVDAGDTSGFVAALLLPKP